MNPPLPSACHEQLELARLELRNSRKVTAALRAEVERLEAQLGSARARIADIESQLTHAQAERRT